MYCHIDYRFTILYPIIVFSLCIPYPVLDDIHMGFDISKSFVISSIFSDDDLSYLLKTTETFDLSTFSSSRTSQQLEYFILTSSIFSDESIKSKIKSAFSDSSSVDLKASII